MNRLTIEYCGQYVPKELCTVDRLGGADDCIDCADNCEECEQNCEVCHIQECFTRLAEYEDTGLTPEQLKEIDRLYTEQCKELAKAPIFPCKIGDIIYEKAARRIFQHVVTGFRIGNLMMDDEDDIDNYSDTEWNIDLKAGGMESSIRLSQFGKTLFLTVEEAKRLKTIDHSEMQEYLRKIYEAGWEKGHEQGKAAGAFVTKESVREVLKEVRGIGENLTDAIISALEHKKLIDGLDEVERLPEEKDTRLYKFGKGGEANDR